MSAVSYKPVAKQEEREIPLQEASVDIWRTKYCLQNSEAKVVTFFYSMCYPSNELRQNYTARNE